MKLSEKWLVEQSACSEGVEWFKNQKERDGVKVVNALMVSEKLDWANWLIVRIMKRKQYCLYALFAAEQVLDIFEEKYPEDKRPRQAIEAARLAIEKPTKENKTAAAYAASAFASASAASAAYAAFAAAYASSAAAYAAYAAFAAAYASSAAAYAASSAAFAAAYAASAAFAGKEMQIKILNYGLELL